MKISDVDYQGDKTKATFYYTAEGRVDFRELIKKMAEAFRIRIEMRQIGMRQEASRLGGIGSCGRELCCSTWLTDFKTVSTAAARYQNLSLNTLKLAGQCGKLKCCLNYELDTYMDALKHIPDNVNYLKTEKGEARLQKTDIFKKLMWFSYPREESWIPIKISRVKEIQQLNKDGVLPADLVELVEVEKIPAKVLDYENVVGQDSLTRLDERSRTAKNKKKNRNKNKPGNQQGEGEPGKPQQQQARQQNEGQQAKQQQQPRQQRPPRPEGAPRPEGNTPRPEGAPKAEGGNRNERNRNRNRNRPRPNNPNNNNNGPKPE
jgi:hypothetical protein